MAKMPAQMLCRFANLALAWQEHQNAALLRRLLPQLVDGIGDRLVDVVFAAFLVRAVTHLDGKHAPRHHQYRGRPFGAGKVLGESVGVNRGRGDDDFQIWSARQDLAQIAQ